MVAAKLANIQHGENQFTVDRQICLSKAEAAAMLNTSVRTVTDATTVQSQGSPELITAVEKGE